MPPLKQTRMQALKAAVATRARWLLVLCALGSLSAPLSRLLTAEGATQQLQWVLELAAHWQWLYLVLGAVCLAILLLLQRAWWLLGPLGVLAASFGLQSGTLPQQAQPVNAEAVLTVGTANLALGTTDFSALVTWLQSANAPDVVFLQEFTDAAQQALKAPALAERYPHRVEAPQPDPFGLAILSRLPLSDVQRLAPADAAALTTLRLRAGLTLPDGRAVRLAAVHPMPPLSAAYARARDETLAEEARHLAQPGALALMAGDFNTTPWARGLFAVEGQLRRASGAVPSWPNAWGLLSVLPLDHVLASSGWRLVEARRGPDLGSDHRPVVVRLAAP